MSIFLTDTFTDANGTALASHTGETGATWTIHPSLPSSDIKIQGNRAVVAVAGAAGSFYYASGTPPSANYTVVANIYAASLPASGYAGVVARMDTAASNFYWAIYNLGSGDWELWKTTTGVVSTKLGSFTQALSVGVSYALTLSCAGSTISVLIDAVSRISVTDSAITAAGKAGIVGYGAFIISTGLQHTDVNATSIPGVTAIGDSVTVGSAASPITNRWSTLYATFLGRAQTNRAVSATQVIDQCSPASGASGNQIYLAANQSTDNLYAWLACYNDMRYKGADASNLESVKRTLRSAVTFLSRPAASVFHMNNGAWTLTGTWVTTNLNPLANTILYPYYTTTPGDKATISVTGTAITISYLSRFGLGDGASNCTVKIDGNTVTAIDTTLGVSSGYSSSSTTYAPMAVRYSGLSAGAHTVEITHASASGKFMQWCFVAGNGEAEGSAGIYIGNPMKMASYNTYSPYNNGSDAAVDAYTAMIGVIIAELVADGHTAYQARTNFYYVPASDIDADGVHPDNSGHAHIADAFENAQSTVPDAPTIGTAVAGNASAQVPYTAPADDGGATITSYTATSTPGSLTNTNPGAGSGTITVNGLTNGLSYTFTVHATNIEGNSAESAASNAIVPAAPSPGPTAQITLKGPTGAVRGNLTSLRWAWFDQVTPDLFGAPTDSGTGESTDANGLFSTLLSNSSLSVGDVGWLIVTNSDGTPASSHREYSGPVETV